MKYMLCTLGKSFQYPMPVFHLSIPVYQMKTPIHVHGPLNAVVYTIAIKASKQYVIVRSKSNVTLHCTSYCILYVGPAADWQAVNATTATNCNRPSYQLFDHLNKTDRGLIMYVGTTEIPQKLSNRNNT